jgi:hypothetical protein
LSLLRTPKIKTASKKFVPMEAKEAERAARTWLRATAGVGDGAGEELTVPGSREKLDAALRGDKVLASASGAGGSGPERSAAMVAALASRGGDHEEETDAAPDAAAARAVALANGVGFLTLAALRTGVAGDRMRKDLVELGRVDNTEVLDVLVSVVDRVRARHPDLAAQVVPSRVTLLAMKWRVDVVLATNEAGSLLTPVVLLDLLLSTGRTVTLSLTQSALATWRHDVARALADVQHLESLAILKVRSAP